MRQILIVASLHEPTPIAKKETPRTEALPALAPATPAPLAKPESAQKPSAAAPKPGAVAPKAAVAPKTAVTVPKAGGKADAKPKVPEAKNAPSTNFLAVITDPASGKKPDITRNFSVVEGTRFEVPFDGTGWTYLGEQTNREGIAYDSRRFEATSLVFLLNPVKAGDYILRFQRQDSLRGISYEELIGVTVTPKSAGATSAAVAPTSAAVAPTSAAAAPTSTAAVPTSAAVAPTSAAAVPTSAAVVPTSAAAAPTSAAVAPLIDAATLATPEAALLAARSELTAGRVPGTLAALDRLLALAPSGTDEAYILYARALEANGPRKDINRAYSYYKKLRDEYPESPYWNEADARCSYIERHYFDIR
jgi:hypothetical protein